MTRTWTVLCVAVCSLLLAGIVVVQVDDKRPRVQSSAAEAEMLDLLNGARVEAGLAPLISEDRLVDIARGWSATMAERGTLSHNPAHRLTENVGVGANAVQVHEAFMASAGHRANVLITTKTRVGVGVVEDGRQLWITQNFDKGTVPPPPPPPPPTTAAPLPPPRPVAPATTAACRR